MCDRVQGWCECSVTCYWSRGAGNVMFVSVVVTLVVVTSVVSSASRAPARPPAVSPTVVCLSRRRSYGSYKRELNAAFFNSLRDLNRNSSFAFRPATTLSHRVVELSEFSPPEVSLSVTPISWRFASQSVLYSQLLWRFKCMRCGLQWLPQPTLLASVSLKSVSL